MERMSEKERAEALEIIRAESDCAWGFPGADDRWLTAVLEEARKLHRLYLRACNQPLTLGEQELIKRTEEKLKAAFKLAGLGLYLNSDPRGNPVGILTPKTGRYNTMGGAEDGWRL